MGLPSSTCLADTGNRIVIGERQDAHATRSGLLHQHRWRKETVRVRAMRMEINEAGGGRRKAGGRRHDFRLPPPVLRLRCYRGSTTSRMAVRSSFSMMTSMK